RAPAGAAVRAGGGGGGEPVRDGDRSVGGNRGLPGHLLLRLDRERSAPVELRSGRKADARQGELRWTAQDHLDIDLRRPPGNCEGGVRGGAHEQARGREDRLLDRDARVVPAGARRDRLERTVRVEERRDGALGV